MRKSSRYNFVPDFNGNDNIYNIYYDQGYHFKTEFFLNDFKGLSSPVLQRIFNIYSHLLL